MKPRDTTFVDTESMAAPFPYLPSQYITNEVIIL